MGVLRYAQNGHGASLISHEGLTAEVRLITTRAEALRGVEGDAEGRRDRVDLAESRIAVAAIGRRPDLGAGGRQLHGRRSLRVRRTARRDLYESPGGDRVLL